MARYIDADKFIERIKVSPAFPNMGMDGEFLRNVVIDLLNNMPTAEVVPKSEVEKLIIDRNAARLGMIAEHERLKMARSDAAREIFEEIEERCVVKWGNSLVFNQDNFCELKQEYTGKLK